MKNLIILFFAVIILFSCKKETTTNATDPNSVNNTNNNNLNLNACIFKDLVGRIYSDKPILTLDSLTSLNPTEYISLTDTISGVNFLPKPIFYNKGEVFINEEGYRYTKKCNPWNSTQNCNAVWEHNGTNFPLEYIPNYSSRKYYANACVFIHAASHFSYYYDNNDFICRYIPIKTSLDSIYRIIDFWSIDTVPILSDTTKWYYIPNPPK
jgi:hypothetical protein